jgi:hypothetical protein
MARTYSTDEVMAMMQAPREDVQMLEKPASPFLDPAQINAAEREVSQPPPEYPRPDNVGAAISDAAGIDRPPAGSSGNMALQNYEAQEAFLVDQTPAPQRPNGGSALLYPSKQETRPSLPKPVYSTDEVMALYTNESKPVYSTKDVMKQMIAPLYDPTAPRPSRDEYFKLKDMEKSLKESGDIEDPGAIEMGMNAVGGVLVTAVDALNSATWKVDPNDGWFSVGGMGVNPAKALTDTWRQSPATARLTHEFVRQQYRGFATGARAMGGPKYRVKETGEFVMDDDESAGGQFGNISPVNIVDRYKAKGLTLAPIGDEDLKDFEYMLWGKKMDRDLAVEKARTAELPPEFLYRMITSTAASVSDYNTGRNDYAASIAPVVGKESQAVVASMFADPAMYLGFGAGTARLGLSAATKGATAETLGIIGKVAQKVVQPTEDALTKAEAFKKLVVSPAKVASAYGAAQGVAWAADKLELPSELKTAAFTAASLYGAYKAGVGVLRFTANRLPEASVILRESANATNGFDAAARKAVAANADVPFSIRERLIRPSQFVAMESTPARLAKNMELSPGTRAMMDKLSNWYVVQGVRGASAVTTGAVKGAAASVPFAELMRSAGDDESAAAIYGMGAAFGSAGGAAERAFGARGRRYAQAESDVARFLTDVQGNTTGLKDVKRYNWIDTEVGRLLTDVELGAGDVSALVKNRGFDELARTAAMQGFFRDRVDFVPLNAADFELNAKGHGADGSAGYFLNMPDGQRPRIFVNVESRRADVEPHEFYEAFFSSDAFSPEQKASMRAAVDNRYGADGLMARGREYAESLIKAENSKNFPNENLFVTSEQIAAKMDQLAQDELGRGGQDALDWVRREVMVEEARMAGIDYAALRRNVPAGQNPITFIENLLGASARALGLSGVRVDPETGMAITPEQLFKENPVAANDPKLVKQLNGYLKTYKQWLNDPQHEAPKGTRIAPDGRAESLANNPNVKFYDGNNGKENSIAFVDASGRVIEKTPKQRAKERKLRGQQIRNMVGSKILEPGNTTFGLKRWNDGRIRAGGKRLPDVMALQTHWKAHLPVIRSIEALSDAGESQQVLYFAKGNSADKVKSSRLSDIDAINREMVFDQWTTNASGDLLAQFLDLTSVRNRAMKAIAERHPALDPANGGPGYKLQAVMDDVNQWMADKGAGKAGEATIGVPRKNVVNALINPGTNFNRGKNDLAGAFGRGSAIKTLLLEGINAVSGTGRKGAAMDYAWANGNFMPDKPAPRPDMDGDLAPPRMPQAMPDASVSGRSDGMPEKPRRYVSMEKFIEEAGDDLGEVLPNAYSNMEFNDNDYPTHLVSFADARNSMYRSRVPSKQFFDWLHSDEVMDGLVFDKEYTPARPGEGASHTRESYQALIERLREISLKPSKQPATGGTRGQAMPDAAVTQDGLVQAPEDAPKFKLPRQAMAQFMPDTGVDLADYADRTILALPADRMGIGSMMVGPKGREREVSVKGQGGAGFMEIYNGGGWAFSDEATGSRFMKRLREAAEPGEGSVLVGITAMSEFNHLKNQTGQLAYVEALEAAIAGKSISKRQADAHIKAISQSITQSTAKSVTDSTRRKFAAIKNLNDFSKAVRNKSLNFADAAPYSVQIARKALPIPYKEAKDIGIAFDDIGKQTADPRYADVPFGTVVALLEVPLEQAPVRSDFHYSYPFKVTGRSIGFLKKYYDVGQLTSDPRIRNSVGAVQAQPLQTVLPKLDQTRKVTRGQAMPDVAPDIAEAMPRFSVDQPPLTEAFSINTTGDVVTGDVIQWEEGVFTSSKKPKFLGNRTVRAVVIKDSYGSDKQQHTFTILPLSSSGTQPIAVGKQTTRKGRNIYRNGTMRMPWTNEDKRQAVANEKHARGDVARAARDRRKSEF